MTAGRLVDQKGQWHLIRAFSRVINKMPDAKLLILGQGGNKDYLESLIKDYKLEDSIKLLGYKSNPYIYMVRSDIFAFSSVYEGLGNILVECMACGLPVVSADYKYGAKELLAPDMDLKTEIHEVTYGEYGILVPEMDDKKYEANASHPPIRYCSRISCLFPFSLGCINCLFPYAAFSKVLERISSPSISFNTSSPFEVFAITTEIPLLSSHPSAPFKYSGCCFSIPQ